MNWNRSWEAVLTCLRVLWHQSRSCPRELAYSWIMCKEEAKEKPASVEKKNLDIAAKKEEKKRNAVWKRCVKGTIYKLLVPPDSVWGISWFHLGSFCATQSSPGGKKESSEWFVRENEEKPPNTSLALPLVPSVECTPSETPPPTLKPQIVIL